MSKGHHTTLLWNVFISFVSRTTLQKKKSIDQLLQVCFSFLKDIIYFFLFCLQVHAQQQNIILSSRHTVPLDLVLLSFVTEQRWSNRHGYAGIRQGGSSWWTSKGLHTANEDRACMEGKQALILQLVAQSWAPALCWPEPMQDKGCGVSYGCQGGLVFQDGQLS